MLFSWRNYILSPKIFNKINKHIQNSFTSGPYINLIKTRNKIYCKYIYFSNFWQDNKLHQVHQSF